MKPTLLYLLPFFLCVTLSGCSITEDDLEVPGNTHSYNLIWPCDEGSYDVETGYGTEGGINGIEQAQYLTETMFKMLGMRKVHKSRIRYAGNENDPNLVDRFSSADAADLADNFEALMLQFRNETPFPFAYTRELDQYDRICFYSTELGELMDSYCLTSNGSHFILNRKVFCDASEQEMQAYIEGVYIRYGSFDSSLNENNVLTFRDSYKIATIGYVLHAIGCVNVSLYCLYCEGDCLPAPTLVVFDPKESLKIRLGIEKVFSIETLLQAYPDSFGNPEICLTVY